MEVTRLCTPLASFAVESTQDRISDQACSKAEHLNLPPAGVTLFFNLRRPLRSADRTRIANAVVQVVADNMPADGERAELEQRPGQPSAVDLIHIDRRYRREVSRWRASSQWTCTTYSLPVSTGAPEIKKYAPAGKARDNASAASRSRLRRLRGSDDVRRARVDPIFPAHIRLSAHETQPSVEFLFSNE